LISRTESFSTIHARHHAAVLNFSSVQADK